MTSPRAQKVKIIETHDGQNTTTFLSDISMEEINLSGENDSSDNNIAMDKHLFFDGKKLYIIFWMKNN